VHALVFDDAGRFCRHDWSVDAHLGASQNGIALSVPPNTAAAISGGRASVPTGQPSEPAFGSLTVLLDAAPLNPRRSTLPASDITTLTDALASLLEQVPARTVRLVAFNLDLQKEVFRRDGFAAGDMDDLSKSLTGLETASIDYRVLQNRGGHLALLADLVNRERRAKADAVIFVGARLLLHDKMPAEFLDAAGEGGGPRFYYLQFRPVRMVAGTDVVNMAARGRRGMGMPRPDPPLGRGEMGRGGYGGEAAADYPDSIRSVVAQLKGKTLLVQTPVDFAKALRQVRRGG
jgi:hypothetical protein